MVTTANAASILQGVKSSSDFAYFIKKYKAAALIVNTLNVGANTDISAANAWFSSVFGPVNMCFSTGIAALINVNPPV